MTKQFWANLALCLFLGALATFAVTRLHSALTPEGLLVSEPEPSAEAAPLLAKVLLTRYDVSQDADHLVQADFYVQNDTDRDIKDINVLCKFYNVRDGYMDRKWWTLDKTVPAGQKVKISSSTRSFINTRAQALNCRIADFQIAEKPFFTLNRSAVAEHGGSAEAGQGHTAPEGSGH